MSDFFKDIEEDVGGVEKKLLGPSYPYYKNVKAPGEMGMSSRGTLSTAAKDVAGLINYAEVLVSGDSNASKSGGPMGNKFFLNTGGQCKDKVSGNLVDRYVYINNVPDGNIPFISDLGIGDISELRGLIPGAFGNLNALNPMKILQSFTTAPEPECQKLTLETIDSDNNVGSETQYVATVDIKDMDACWFDDNVNPATNDTCKESYGNIGGTQNIEKLSAPEVLFYSGLGLGIVYGLFRGMRYMKLR
jgi:hypothetical protein